jgi:hypothetical protein
VVSVWRMVNDGWRVAIKMEPLRYLDGVRMNGLARVHVSSAYPMANVRQSAAGARAVIGSKMVLADMCSEVEGSNKMMLPCAFPVAS